LKQDCPLTSDDRSPVSDVTFRLARTDDIPRIEGLVSSAELPAAFIAEFLDGFIVAERDGAIIACGGVEMYETCAVIRSVVVEPDARGAGIGIEIATRLIDTARGREATDLYLFTMQAHAFWLRLGFEDVSYDDWKEPARACWQYQFLAQNRDMMPDVRPMWRRAAP
jgi:amino-acid N-acetyltransferase